MIIEVENRSREDGVIRPQLVGLFHHPVQRLLARLGEELRVLGDLAAHDVAQHRHDVLAEMARPDRVPAHEPQGAGDPLAGHAIRGDHDHLCTSV